MHRDSEGQHQHRNESGLLKFNKAGNYVGEKLLFNHPTPESTTEKCLAEFFVTCRETLTFLDQIKSSSGLSGLRLTLHGSLSDQGSHTEAEEARRRTESVLNADTDSLMSFSSVLTKSSINS